MREEIVYCDICNDEISAELNQEIGSITIWNNLYGEGTEEDTVIDSIEFQADECCFSCIKIIHKRIKAAIKKIKKDKGLKNG